MSTLAACFLSVAIVFAIILLAVIQALRNDPDSSD